MHWMKQVSQNHCHVFFAMQMLNWGLGMSEYAGKKQKKKKKQAATAWSAQDNAPNAREIMGNQEQHKPFLKNVSCRL